MLVEPLTIHDAAQATGWSPRMLRYVERLGLVDPPRSASGYRLYGPEEVRRLRSLRELTARFDVALGDVAFALRLRGEPELNAAIDAWPAGTREPAGLR
ncbi:MAG: MerR family transcriptional regulator, copper efflux regulator [Solirubrobacteraceae bacterium]|jgi:DNA-binding transcriptional MerR regulator|nr:MerR family transcriptional regulator, copper efflux regulator [Solirubrobacteraceae bacterium]